MSEAIPLVPTTVVTYPDGRMDRKNAARYLGFAEKTLAMHACHGTGPTFVKRGRVFYYQKDLDEWMQAGRVVSTAQGATLAAKHAGMRKNAAQTPAKAAQSRMSDANVGAGPEKPERENRSARRDARNRRA